MEREPKLLDGLLNFRNSHSATLAGCTQNGAANIGESAKIKFDDLLSGFGVIAKLRPCRDSAFCLGDGNFNLLSILQKTREFLLLSFQFFFGCEHHLRKDCTP